MKTLSALALMVLALGCSENQTPYGPDAGATASPPQCLPNLDGTLTRDEMPTQLDTAVPYLVARSAAVDLSSGTIDLRSEIPGEEKITLEATQLDGLWFADAFPADSIAVPLNISRDTFGILRSGESAVSLLGIVSVQPDRTLLQYQSPIDLYRFPLSVGASWTSRSAVTGTLAAVPYNGTDQYQVRVEGSASVSLPHLRFTDAYRVHTTVTSDSGAAGVVVTRQQISLISECFGEITRVVSDDNDTASNVTTAAELWRFSL